MLTGLHRAALCAVLPFCAGISGARAQTQAPNVQRNPFAKQPLIAAPSDNAPQTQVNPFAKRPDVNRLSAAQPADAFFGNIEIDESRAKDWSDLIDSQALRKEIANLPGALIYREGAVGFYRVGFEAVGTRANGRLRVSVTIVGQSGDRTILATGQSTQRWQNGAFLYQEPQLDSPQMDSPRESFGNNSPLQTPTPTNRATFNPASFRSPFAQFVSDTYREFCAKSREEKTGHADGKKSSDNPKREEKSAPDPQPKREEKRAPDPEPKREPKREERPEPKREEKRAPDPQPEPRREERPQPQRDDRPAWERKTKPRREENPPPQPAPPPIPVPQFPAPQPKIEPQRAPNPQPHEPSRPNLPTVTLPPFASAPNSAPPARGNTTAPDPNPPFSRTVPLTPNPNPPNRGGVHHESRPPSRPRWDDPYYGRYPYPYPNSYPYPYPDSYPYPYPVPYPSPYPYPVPYPSPVPYPEPTSNIDDGAREAFEFAIISARADAQADFDRQLTGETAPSDEPNSDIQF